MCVRVCLPVSDVVLREGLALSEQREARESNGRSIVVPRTRSSVTTEDTPFKLGKIPFT